jgi:phenylpyruvate tautomerase PptA (4-oxalocrotonate tautomerase family)
MPILHVKALPQQKQFNISEVLKKTTLAISEAYGCAPQQVWATWEEIPPDHYVEGDISRDAQPETTHPPIAELICFEGKDASTIETVLSVAAKTLSEGLGIPNNIFIRYSEAKSGQVIAGNGIVRT